MKKIYAFLIVIMIVLPIGNLATTVNADDEKCLEYYLGLPTDFYFDMDDFDNPFNCIFSNGICIQCTQFEIH